MSIEKSSLAEKFSQFHDYWNPRIIAELNGQAVKIAKIKGEFPWHSHQNEDEMFYVVKGSIFIELRDKRLELHEGDYVVIPKGVEHRPTAQNEAQILMFEPLETLNTGDQLNEFTQNNLDRI